MAALPAVADVAFITCQTGDEISVIDLAQGKETMRWQVPGKPAGVAVTPDGVYAVSADSKVIRQMHPESGQVTAETILDGGPIGVVLDASRDRVFVSDWYGSRLWILTASDLRLQRTLNVGSEPAGLALSPDGRFLASAEKGADQTSVFDAKTLELRHRIDVGTRPFGLAFGPDGNLYVANVGSNDVTVIDPQSGRHIATVAVGERPYGIAFAKGLAFVTNQYAGTVSVFDMKTFEVVKTLTVGEYPEGIDTTENKEHVVLANWFDNTVTIVDAQALNVVDTIETCDGPRAFGAFILGSRK